MKSSFLRRDRGRTEDPRLRSQTEAFGGDTSDSEHGPAEDCHVLENGGEYAYASEECHSDDFGLLPIVTRLSEAHEKEASDAMADYFQQTRATAEIGRIRAEVIEIIEDVCQRMLFRDRATFGCRRCQRSARRKAKKSVKATCTCPLPSVCVFGSTAVGLDSFGSDLDIAIPHSISKPCVGIGNQAMARQLLSRFLSDLNALSHKCKKSKIASSKSICKKRRRFDSLQSSASSPPRSTPKRRRVTVTARSRRSDEVPYERYCFELKPILRARVPIIKVAVWSTAASRPLHEGPLMEVDLAALCQQFSTNKLVSYWMSLDTRVRVLVVAVKRWAKVRRICDATRHQPNTFGFTLLMLKFLQLCEPPVLPVAFVRQSDRQIVRVDARAKGHLVSDCQLPSYWSPPDSDHFTELLSDARLAADGSADEKREEEDDYYYREEGIAAESALRAEQWPAERRFSIGPLNSRGRRRRSHQPSQSGASERRDKEGGESKPWRSNNELSVYQLLVSFFEMYSRFDFDNLRISVTSGRALERKWNAAAAMMVCDPLRGASNNVTRNVDTHTLRLLVYEFWRAYKCLINGHFQLLFDPYATNPIFSFPSKITSAISSKKGDMHLEEAEYNEANGTHKYADLPLVYYDTSDNDWFFEEEADGGKVTFVERSVEDTHRSAKASELSDEISTHLAGGDGDDDDDLEAVSALRIGATADGGFGMSTTHAETLIFNAQWEERTMKRPVYLSENSADDADDDDDEDENGEGADDCVGVGPGFERKKKRPVGYQRICCKRKRKDKRVRAGQFATLPFVDACYRMDAASGQWQKSSASVLTSTRCPQTPPSSESAADDSDGGGKPKDKTKIKTMAGSRIKTKKKKKKRKTEVKCDWGVVVESDSGGHVSDEKKEDDNDGVGSNGKLETDSKGKKEKKYSSMYFEKVILPVTPPSSSYSTDGESAVSGGKHEEEVALDLERSFEASPQSSTKSSMYCCQRVRVREEAVVHSSEVEADDELRPVCRYLSLAVLRQLISDGCFKDVCVAIDEKVALGTGNVLRVKSALHAISRTACLRFCFSLVKCLWHQFATEKAETVCIEDGVAVVQAMGHLLSLSAATENEDLFEWNLGKIVQTAEGKLGSGGHTMDQLLMSLFDNFVHSLELQSSLRATVSCEALQKCYEYGITFAISFLQSLGRCKLDSDWADTGQLDERLTRCLNGIFAGAGDFVCSEREVSQNVRVQLSIVS